MEIFKWLESNILGWLFSFCAQINWREKIVTNFKFYQKEKIEEMGKE